MSKGGKTGGGPQPSAPGILPGGGPLRNIRASSSPGKGGRQQSAVPEQQNYGDPAFGSGSSGRAGPWDSDYYTRDISNQGGWGQPQQFGGGWGQPQFQGGFGGYGQGLQRPSGPGKGGPFQGPGPSYNQPQMPFGYGQMQYSPQRFHGYGVPSSMAQPFPDVRSPSPGYPQPPPDFQLPPPGYPQQYGRQPGMGGPGKGGRRRGPPPYMGGRARPHPSEDAGTATIRRRAQMLRKLGRDDPLRLQLPEQYNAQKEQLMRQQQQYAALAPAYRDVGEMAYSGGGGIAGIYGPGGRVR